MPQKGLHNCKKLAVSVPFQSCLTTLQGCLKKLSLFLIFWVFRGADKCYNRSLCEEHLNVILPSNPPFHPRQFKTCAVVGNSGDLLKTEFGEEIDSHDAVIRDNEAPVNEVPIKDADNFSFCICVPSLESLACIANLQLSVCICNNLHADSKC